MDVSQTPGASSWKDCSPRSGASCTAPVGKISTPSGRNVHLILFFSLKDVVRTNKATGALLCHFVHVDRRVTMEQKTRWTSMYNDGTSPRSLQVFDQLYKIHTYATSRSAFSFLSVFCSNENLIGTYLVHVYHDKKNVLDVEENCNTTCPCPTCICNFSCKKDKHWPCVIIQNLMLILVEHIIFPRT